MGCLGLRPPNEHYAQPSGQAGRAKSGAPLTFTLGIMNKDSNSGITILSLALWWCAMTAFGLVLAFGKESTGLSTLFFVVAIFSASVGWGLWHRKSWIKTAFLIWSAVAIASGALLSWLLRPGELIQALIVLSVVAAISVVLNRFVRANA